MTDKKFTALANSWAEKRTRLESADLINRRLLHDTIVSRSFWLAPKPAFFYIFFSIMFVFAVCYCIFVDMAYWPVAAVCPLAIADMAWQTRMRRKIRCMDGGVIGIRHNLSRYRRGYIWLSVAMWILGVIYLWWMCNYLSGFIDRSHAIVIIMFTAVAMVVVYTVRTWHTFRALGLLRNLADDLSDLDVR